MSLSVTFWGTRGSIPAPGAGTAKYGGNTPCVTVASGDALLILDGGTGIRLLGKVLRDGDPASRTHHLLLSHTHWDHIQGIPFFAPLHRPGNRVNILGPAGLAGQSIEAVLTGQMTTPVFPVPASEVAAELSVRAIVELDFQIGAFRIRAIEARHPAPTYGYAIRLEADGPPLVTYLTDNELRSFDPPARRRLIGDIEGSRVLVHDAMFSEAEAPERVGWGHSTPAEAVSLALEAGCGHLVLFHHDPDHDDDSLVDLLVEATRARDQLGGQLAISLAKEGESLTLETP